MRLEDVRLKAGAGVLRGGRGGGVHALGLREQELSAEFLRALSLGDTINHLLPFSLPPPFFPAHACLQVSLLS